MLDSGQEEILERIVFASERDPGMPRFPVTRTYSLHVDGFCDAWVKDESTNETGTHKDRMAWEIVMAYKDMLLARRRGTVEGPLPHCSIISAGSAALAVQHQMRRYGLPDLKALVDEATPPEMVGPLERIGVEVYRANLAERKLRAHDILSLTRNERGFDITSNKGFGPGTHFYDWMADEILNVDADYVFMPFGTGQLYENVMDNAHAVATGRPSGAYAGDAARVPRMHLIGVTSNDPETKAVKLYAPFRPFTDAGPEWVHLYAQRGWCGARSGIMELDEGLLDEAYAMLTAQGVLVEHSAAAGLAGLLAMRASVPADAKILVVSTGKTKLPPM